MVTPYPALLYPVNKALPEVQTVEPLPTQRPFPAGQLGDDNIAEGEDDAEVWHGSDTVSNYLSLVAMLLQLCRWDQE